MPKVAKKKRGPKPKPKQLLHSNDLVVRFTPREWGLLTLSAITEKERKNHLLRRVFLNWAEQNQTRLMEIALGRADPFPLPLEEEFFMGRPFITEVTKASCSKCGDEGELPLQASVARDVFLKEGWVEKGDDTAICPSCAKKMLSPPFSFGDVVFEDRNFHKPPIPKMESLRPIADQLGIPSRKRKRSEIYDDIYLFLKNGFDDWLSTLQADPGVMGGAVTFPNSRLTVHHVGEMLIRGEDPKVILEDYPYLTEQDLEYARRYVEEKHEVSS